MKKKVLMRKKRKKEITIKILTKRNGIASREPDTLDDHFAKDFESCPIPKR